jgi:hypothetical protein
MMVSLTQFFPLQPATPASALPIHTHRAGDGFFSCQGTKRLLPQNSQKEINDFIFSI